MKFNSAKLILLFLVVRVSLAGEMTRQSASYKNLNSFKIYLDIGIE
jgi:hypothetical protein